MDRKSSLSNFKTPRTLIAEYLEASKTQTLRPTRDKVRLTRTPDTGPSFQNSSKSPARRANTPVGQRRTPSHPAVQHDRVSSLRGKRTRSLSNVTEESTPRTLIEGFLAGEDTTAPAVRRLRRTSQIYSASQPVGSPGKRKLSAQANMTDPDMETPRTLIQNYLRNATNVIETPVVNLHQESPETSPTIPSITGSNEYHTPSPFRSSSQSSGRSETARSARRSERRKHAEKYHIAPQVQEEKSKSWENSSLSDIIEPTSPASYHVPSPFRSSPTSVTDILVSQSQRSMKDRLQWVPKQRLNISVPHTYITREIEQVSPRSDQAQNGDEESNSGSYEEEIIPESQSKRQKTHHEEHIVYELPLNPGDLSGDIDGYDNDMTGTRDIERSRQSIGRSRLSSIEVSRRAGDFDRSKKVSTESSFNRLSNDKSRWSGVYREENNSLEGEKENVEIEFDGRRSSSRASIHEMSGNLRVADHDEEVTGQQRIGQNIDEGVYRRHTARDGRWSEGHQLRDDIREEVRPGRYSEGHLVLGQGQRSHGQSSDLKYLRISGNYPVHSPSHRSNASTSNRSENSWELTRTSRSPRNPGHGKLIHTQNELLSQSQKQHQSDLSGDGYESDGSPHEVGSHKRWQESLSGQNRSHDDEFEVDVDHLEARISAPRTGHVHALPDDTAGFSPRVSSTQRISTVALHSQSVRTSEHHNQEQFVQDNVSRFSPRISSTQKAQSIIDDGTTVIVNKQHGLVGNLPDTTANFSPKVASTQRMYTTINNMVDNGPLDIASPSPVVSPQRESLSHTETPGSSRRRVHSSGHSGEGDPDSPLDTVTPSPVVSPQRGSLSKGRTSRSQASVTNTPSSSAQKSRTSSRLIDIVTPSKTPGSSTQKIRTSSSTSQMKTPRSSTEKRRTPGSHRTWSLRSSKLKSVSGGRRTVPSETIIRSPENNSLQSENNASQFSSRLSSAKRRQSISDGSTTVIARKHQGQVQTVPDNTASFSPRMSSTQKMTTYIGHADNDSPSHTVSSLPVVSPTDGDISPSDVSQDDEAPTTSQIRNEVVPSASAAGVNTKKPRRPRNNLKYSMPVSTVKKEFSRFAGMRVSKEAVEEVMKVSEVYWDNLASDLEAYARHAGRKRINMDDFVLLFKRQGHINEKQCMNSLIEKYLPMEERQKLIPVARAYNRIEPKL